MNGAVYLNAQPGSFVGGGIGAEEVIWAHGVEGLFSTSRNFDQGITVTFDDGNFWNIDFAAPTFDPITNTNNGNDLVYPVPSQAQPVFNLSKSLPQPFHPPQSLIAQVFPVFVFEIGSGADSNRGITCKMLPRG